MPECLGNLMAIISLKEYMNTPTLLWPLINLSNQILKLIPKTLLTANVGVSITTALDLVVSLPNHE